MTFIIVFHWKFNTSWCLCIYSGTLFICICLPFKCTIQKYFNISYLYIGFAISHKRKRKNTVRKIPHKLNGWSVYISLVHSCEKNQAVKCLS